jgi:ubiquinone/menaquinone biosynthesis C-methylase UbiE
MMINKKALTRLTCPACSTGNGRISPLAEQFAGSADRAESISCKNCGALFLVHGGILDLVGGGPRELDNSQKAMEFGPIVAMYELMWRPLVTMPFSDLAWEMKTVSRLLDLGHCTDLLDLACGPGNFTRLFAENNRACSIIGADYSLPMLRKGADRLRKINWGNITLMRADVTRWPFMPGSFDRIHCAGALHLFPNLSKVFISIAQSLKPGGIFVGATYLRGKSAFKRAMQRVISSRSSFHWFGPDELAGLAGNAGLTGWEQYVNKEGIVFRAVKGARP